MQSFLRPIVIKILGEVLNVKYTEDGTYNGPFVKVGVALYDVRKSNYTIGDFLKM